MSVNLAYIPILGLLSFTAIAQPVISNIQLSKSADEFTTLSGSGFGSFEGEVLGWDDFDKQPPSAPLNTVNNLTGHSWVTGGDSNALVDTRYMQSGSQSVKLDWLPGKTSIGYFGWTGKSPVSQMYISYWRRVEGSFNSPDSNHQQLYISGTDGRKPPQLSLKITGPNACWMLTSKLTQQQQTNTNPGDGTNCWTHTNGKFQHWEFAIDLTQARVNAWLDGAKIFNINEPLNTPMSGITEVRLGYQTSGLSEPASSWFDDIYIASSLARVEACNAPDYASCRRRHLQYVAPENWRDGKIQFHLHNLRMFRGEPIYLYVIDARGQVSNGIPIARPVMKAN